ncbi:hypothetical protein INS49_005942 [Diaporthe citri]|uniref:uncharacterized protein n=1 Tax=Diaporthe citri TaxID=83186 RepID=UPI001C818AFA|nr:uncharacterized protein INS49_005942 [Diaporthe citri]KAG6364341.1 hypothetical protein INS49_005942 [Diaporthe citri]
MANTNTKATTKTPPDLPTLQSSLTRLSTAAHLLDGFVHRNKNQHRGTRWWAPFDMLRRSVRKLVPDLEGAVQRSELLSSSSSGGASAKRRKTNDKGAGAGAKQPELEKVEARAQWVHDVVAIKAFEAFTQLLADRQFAQLGLMLIGVLAQVEASVAPFVRPAEPPGGDDENDAAGQDPARAVVARMAARRADGPVASQVGGSASSSLGAGHEDDLGVAISRDELGDDDEGEEEDVTSGRPRRPSPPPKEKRPEKGESKGKKRPRADDTGSSRIAKPEKPARPELSRDEKKAKKKKKKKGGDEFDDLFSSLM